MVEPSKLEEKISKLLDNFYERRLGALMALKLKDTLKRKNPYLYKATGYEIASEIVEGILLAYMSSSDETIFGDAFFEPLAKFVSGGQSAPSEGVDISIETDTRYSAIAVKSGKNVFNAQSRKKQGEDFKSLENRIRKLQKHFDPIVGYCYGKKKQNNQKAIFRELAGQSFWYEITGEKDFYLKIIELMGSKPQSYTKSYKEAWSAALNRFTGEFINDFCFEDGSINWIKLTEFNSGNKEL